MSSPNISVVESPTLSKPYDTRYVIIEDGTGKVLDDANGYGYKTKQNAHRAWGYKSAPKATKKKREDTKRRVQQWCRDNKKIVDDLSDEAFYAAKDCEDFDAANVTRYLRQNGIELPFSVNDFLRHW